MASDSESERLRLTGLYGGLSDGELLKIAADSPSLTDTALQALSSEINRRGLEPPRPEPFAGSDEVEFQRLITIRKFRDLPEALFAKGALDSAGIETFLTDDNMVRMDWFISNLLGGVKLQVRPEDADAANEILSQPVPEGFNVEGVGEYQQPRCPSCQSFEVSFEELNKPLAFVSSWLIVPVPIHGKGWNCHACGHRWQDCAGDKAELTSSPSEKPNG